jgi:hypothetical protein
MKLKLTDTLIVALLSINVVTSLQLNSHFDIFFIFGIVSLLLIGATAKKYPDISFGILFLSLFFSSFHMISFGYAFVFTISCIFGSVNLISLSLLLVLIYKRFDKILDLKEKWFSPTTQEEQEHIIQKTVVFKKQFQDLSTTELENKLKNLQIVDEAKTAIVELLWERKQQ